MRSTLPGRFARQIHSRAPAVSDGMKPSVRVVVALLLLTPLVLCTSTAARAESYCAVVYRLSVKAVGLYLRPGPFRVAKRRP